MSCLAGENGAEAICHIWRWGAGIVGCNIQRQDGRLYDVGRPFCICWMLLSKVCLQHNLQRVTSLGYSVVVVLWLWLLGCGLAKEVGWQLSKNISGEVTAGLLAVDYHKIMHWGLGQIHGRGTHILIAHVLSIGDV